MMKLKGSKRFGNQSCDSCSREFTVVESEWNCPFCGFDNRAGVGVVIRRKGNRQRETGEARTQ